jgi:glycosyltransferase involved in cell wall biosynthesis
VASSITDGVPNSMIEGMIMGAFPVQSNSGSVDEYVRNGINGFLLEPMDVDGFAEKLKVAINDDTLVDSAVDYSYHLIKSKMDFMTVKEKVFEFYANFRKGN